MTEREDRASAPPRVLRALVEELRESDPPSIAWDEMEARLLARIDAAGLAVGAGVDATSASAPSDASDERAEILVPWDDDPLDAEELELEVTGAAAADLAARDGAVRSDRATPHLSPAQIRLAAAPPSSTPRTLDRTPLTRRPRRWALGAAIATMAVAAAWLLAPRSATPVVAEPVDLASVAVEPRLGDAFDLAGLRVGDVVEAAEGPVSFGRAGVLRWTLSAGGRVRVVRGVGHEELRHVIALEAGALDVDVVPLEERRPEDGDVAMGRPGEAAAGFERFVVEVGGARVAVHGTAFRVVRSSRGVVLDVVRGVVAVGPLAGGEGSGQLVQAPARAAFDLEGTAIRALPALAEGGVGRSAPRTAAAPVAREVVIRSSGDERYAGAAEPVDEPPKQVSGRPASVAPAVAANERERAGERAPAEGVDARDEPTWTADRVRSEVTSCIARAGDRAGDGARVTIASSVVIDVDAAGGAQGVRFDPPIRPDLQACGQPVLRARFPAGSGRLRVPLEVRLGPAK